MSNPTSIFEKLHVPTTVSAQIKKILPVSVRKTIKSYIGKYLAPATEFIPESVYADWQDFNQNRPSNTIDILNFSVISWDLRFQRPQHLALELSKMGHRIFYIDHEFLPYSKKNQKFAPIRVVKKANNVYQVTISASRELFIYRDKPSSDDIKILMASIRKLIYKAKVINPIAKIDHPFWANIVDELSMPILYDCMDNHSGFPDSGKNLAKFEDKLIKASNINIVTSKYLLRMFESKNVSNITEIKNAGDFVHFSKINPKINVIPKSLKNLPHPIIGYNGAISSWIDTELIETAVKSNPQYSFVFTGKVENSTIQKLASKYSNVHLMGEVPYDLVPAYVNQFDVCLIPFVLNELIKATHPIKVFEYFATGKPVIATNMPELNEYKKFIYFANKNNINSQIAKALTESKDKISGRITLSQNNIWENRGIKLSETISSYLFPRISVIVLSYNHPDLLKTALDSLSSSMYPNLEIIVVDNNSSQETIDLLKSYSANKQLAKVIFNNQNYGFSKGNNIGLRQSTGDYIVLLNNDVKVTPGSISRLLFHCRKNNVGLVGPITNSIGNEAKVDLNYVLNDQADFLDKTGKYTSMHWGEGLVVKNIAAFCWIMSRQVYKKIGDLDEIFGRGMFEDDDYCRRVINSGLTISIVDDVYIHHFGGSSFKQIETAEYKKLFDENKHKYEQKWHVKWTPHRYRS